jgi:D-cysteine desulfhydrase
VPDRIYIAMGTMGSAVGLALGLEIAALRSEIALVRASSPETSSEARFFAMADETVAFARSIDPTFPALRLGKARVRFVGKYLGKGYGRPTRDGLSAIKLAAETQGLTLEPTYTGKALAALVDDAKAQPEKILLFWNTHNAQPLVTDCADIKSFPVGLRPYVKESKERP